MYIWLDCWQLSIDSMHNTVHTGYAWCHMYNCIIHMDGIFPRIIKFSSVAIGHLCAYSRGEQKFGSSDQYPTCLSSHSKFFMKYIQYHTRALILRIWVFHIYITEYIVWFMVFFLLDSSSAFISYSHHDTVWYLFNATVCSMYSELCNLYTLYLFSFHNTAYNTSIYAFVLVLVSRSSRLQWPVFSRSHRLMTYRVHLKIDAMWFMVVLTLLVKE